MLRRFATRCCCNGTPNTRRGSVSWGEVEGVGVGVMVREWLEALEPIEDLAGAWIVVEEDGCEEEEEEEEEVKDEEEGEEEEECWKTEASLLRVSK